MKPARGVEIRENDIRIRFTLDGRRQYVPTGKAPTAANIAWANRRVADVRSAIRAENFSWEHFFPDHVRAVPAGASDFMKTGELWLAKKSGLAAATKYQYGLALKAWGERELRAGRRLKDVPMGDVRHSELAALVGGTAWPSARMRNNSLIVLRGVFDLWRADDRRHRDNPADGIENARFQKGKPDPLTPDEAERVLARMKKRYAPEVYWYFVFAIFAFPRPEEQIALRWDRVDFARRTVVIDVVRTFKGTEKEIKTYEERELELDGNDRAWEAVMAMKQYTHLMPHGHVFQNPRTREPWHDERSQRDHHWAPTLKAEGIRGRRAYCTRHTGITLALMAGCDPSWVAHMAGHRTTKMIWEVYSRWIPGADKGAEAKKMGARYRQVEAA